MHLLRLGRELRSRSVMPGPAPPRRPWRRPTPTRIPARPAGSG